MNIRQQTLAKTINRRKNQICKICKIFELKLQYNKLKLAYEKLTNKKKDAKNKIVSYLKNNYETGRYKSLKLY